MQLSQVMTEGNFKLLLMGEPGIGKTIFACSLPGKTRILDFDLKADSAALFYRDNPERLSNIEVTQLGRKFGQRGPIDELQKIINEEFIPQQRRGKMEFDNLVIDTLTTLGNALLEHITLVNIATKRVNHSFGGMQASETDYGVLKSYFQRIITGLMDLPCNVVICAHITAKQNPKTGIIDHQAMAPGSFGKEIPTYFKETWRAFIGQDGKRYAQTQPDSQYACRSQIPGLPNPVRLDYSEIVRFL